jgi:hypothetical protein
MSGGFRATGVWGLPRGKSVPPGQHWLLRGTRKSSPATR